MRPRLQLSAVAGRDNCAVQKVRELFIKLKDCEARRCNADVFAFMSWVFSLPNVTLRVNEMEDPHDFLVPLWQLMTMAGGGCLEQCGEGCVNACAHMELMKLGVEVANEYECSTCRGRWLRYDNGYERCVSLSLPEAGSISLEDLLNEHCIEGVQDSVVNRECQCGNGVCRVLRLL